MKLYKEISTIVTCAVLVPCYIFIMHELTHTKMTPTTTNKTSMFFVSNYGVHTYFDLVQGSIITICQFHYVYFMGVHHLSSLN